MDKLKTGETFILGNVKAWLVRNTSAHQHCWVHCAGDVPSIIGEEERPFSEEQVAAMNSGDALTSGEWTVECHAVDREWLNNLHEFDGW